MSPNSPFCRTGVRAALLEAWSRGYLPDSNALSDYRIGGILYGDGGAIGVDSIVLTP